MDLPELEKIEIKYGCVGFKERNNLFYRDFFRFEMDFELENKEALGYEFDKNLIGFHLETSNLDEALAKDFCLYLVTNSTHGK
jgi:hypothetical protein